MRNVVVGSFLGFVLGAAFLAACGGGGTSGPSPQLVVTGEWRWGPLQPTETIATSAILSGTDVWTSSASYDNSAADKRHRFAALELAYTPSPAQSIRLPLQIGILPQTDGSHYASEPQWVAQVEVSLDAAGRAIVTGVPIPPTPLKFALRLSSGTSSIRTSLTITPYNEVTP